MKNLTLFGKLGMLILFLSACGSQSGAPSTTANKQVNPGQMNQKYTNTNTNTSTDTPTDMSKLPPKPDCTTLDLQGKWIESTNVVAAGSQPVVSNTKIKRNKAGTYYLGINVFKKASNCQNITVTHFKLGLDQANCILTQVETNRYYINKSINPPAGSLDVSTAAQTFYVAQIHSLGGDEVSSATLVPCKDAACKYLKLESTFTFTRNESGFDEDAVKRTSGKDTDVDTTINTSTITSTGTPTNTHTESDADVINNAVNGVSGTTANTGTPTLVDSNTNVTSDTITIQNAVNSQK